MYTAILLEKNLQHGCFPVNFVKLSRTTNSVEYLWMSAWISTFSHHIYFVHHHWQSSWYKTKGKPLIILFSCCSLFYLKQILNLKVWRCAIKPVKPGVNWRFENVILWHLIKCYMQTFRLLLHVAFPFTLTTYFANCFTSIHSRSENVIL